MRRTLLLGLVIAYATSTTVFAQKKERVEPASVYVMSAKIALKSKEYKRALNNLTICLENYPENAEAHMLMGVIWAEKDEIDSMMIEFNLARQYVSKKKLKKFEKKMNPIEEDKWETNFNSGVAYINLADSLNNVAGETGDVAEGQKLRELVAQALDESGANFRNCTLLKPDEFRGWFNLGLVFDRKRDYAEAAQIYKKSEETFYLYTLEDSTIDLSDTTLFYQGEGEKTPLFKELTKKFKKKTEDLRNRYKGLLTALGGVYFELEEYENCIIVFRRLLGYYEEDLNALEYIGNSHQQLGNAEEALKWINLVITKNPDDKDRIYNVGAYWYNEGVEAKKEYEHLLKEMLQGSKDPNIKDVVAKADERYRTNFTRATEMFARVLELNIKDKDTWKLKGVAMFFLDEYEEAIPVLEKAREMLPDDTSICPILRECYRKQGDVEKVLQLTEECGL